VPSPSWTSKKGRENGRGGGSVKQFNRIAPENPLGNHLCLLGVVFTEGEGGNALEERKGLRVLTVKSFAGTDNNRWNDGRVWNENRKGEERRLDTDQYRHTEHDRGETVQSEYIVGRKREKR